MIVTWVSFYLDVMWPHDLRRLLRHWSTNLGQHKKKIYLHKYKTITDKTYCTWKSICKQQTQRSQGCCRDTNRFTTNAIIWWKWIGVSVMYLWRQLTASFRLLQWQLCAVDCSLGLQYIYANNSLPLHPLSTYALDIRCMGISSVISPLMFLVGWLTHTLWLEKSNTCWLMHISSPSFDPNCVRVCHPMNALALNVGNINLKDAWMKNTIWTRWHLFDWSWFKNTDSKTKWSRQRCRTVPLLCEMVETKNQP